MMIIFGLSFEYKLQDTKTKNVNKTRMKSFKLFN